MSGYAIGWAFKQADLTPTQRLVLLGYADNADQNGKCWPDKQTIIKKTGLSQATVYRAIKELTARGLFSEGEDEQNRLCIWLAVPSHGDNSDSHSENDLSQSEKPYIDEPPEEPPTNQAPVNDEWNEWLEDYREVTGNTSVRGSKAARTAFNARRRDGYDLAALKRATRGAHSDQWMRENGRDVPETILRDSNIARYLKLAESIEPAPDDEFDPDAELERDLRALHGE